MIVLAVIGWIALLVVAVYLFAVGVMSCLYGRMFVGGVSLLGLGALVLALVIIGLAWHLSPFNPITLHG